MMSAPQIISTLSLALALTSVVCVPSSASEIDYETINPLPIIPFELNYEADFNGMQITAVHQLTELETGQFREFFEARGLLGKVTETEFFEITEGQRIVPKENTYRRSLIGTKRTEKQVYNWPLGTVTYSKGKQSKPIELKPDYLDSMSHKQQLRRDLAAGKDTLTYAVIFRGKLKQYTYKVIADEVLPTPIGPLDTRLIKRISDDGSKTTKVWLAKDWDFIMIKFETTKEGDTQKMQFTGGQLGDQIIQPLEIDLET